MLGEGNLISGNGEGGVSIAGIGTSNNKVLGNRIGTNLSGTRALGNTLSASIHLGATDNNVGGSAAGEETYFGECRRRRTHFR